MTQTTARNQSKGIADKFTATLSKMAQALTTGSTIERNLTRAHEVSFNQADAAGARF